MAKLFICLSSKALVSLIPIQVRNWLSFRLFYYPLSSSRVICYLPLRYHFFTNFSHNIFEQITLLLNDRQDQNFKMHEANFLTWNDMTTISKKEKRICRVINLKSIFFARKLGTCSRTKYEKPCTPTSNFAASKNLLQEFQMELGSAWKGIFKSFSITTLSAANTKSQLRIIPKWATRSYFCCSEWCCTNWSLNILKELWLKLLWSY